MIYKILSFAFSLLFVLSAALSADETKSRQVIGGDLIYSANATGNSEEQAVFIAESQAVRMITIECSVPHREIKIFNFSVNPMGTKYVAQVSAGLPIESCEQARNAPADQKLELTNPTLAASQRVYEQILEGERNLYQQPTRAIAQNTQAQVTPVRYAWTPPGYDRYLNAQTNCREKIRNLIRRGDDAQASELAAQCRN
jgi:hypothetical protein